MDKNRNIQTDNGRQRYNSLKLQNGFDKNLSKLQRNGDIMFNVSLFHSMFHMILFFFSFYYIFFYLSVHKFEGGGRQRRNQAQPTVSSRKGKRHLYHAI